MGRVVRVLQAIAISETRRYIETQRASIIQIPSNIHTLWVSKKLKSSKENKNEIIYTWIVWKKHDTRPTQTLTWLLPRYMKFQSTAYGWVVSRALTILCSWPLAIVESGPYIHHTRWLQWSSYYVTFRRCAQNCILSNIHEDLLNDPNRWNFAHISPM